MIRWMLLMVLMACVSAWAPAECDAAWGADPPRAQGETLYGGDPDRPRGDTFFVSEPATAERGAARTSESRQAGGETFFGSDATKGGGETVHGAKPAESKGETVFGEATASADIGDASLPLNQGIDRLAQSLMKRIATRYFNLKNRPVIKAVVFDFTDRNGDITVGSRYVANRIRLALGNAPQFELLMLPDPKRAQFCIDSRDFAKDVPLRDRIIGEMKADVYVFGSIDTSEGTNVACEVDIWGVTPPYDDFSKIISLKELREKERSVDELILDPLPWRATFNASGLDFFNQVIRRKVDEEKTVENANLGEVIFLSQPMCDDLDLSWQVKADGMVYDVRKESEEGTLRSRTGQMMQSRIKSEGALKELSFVIRNFGLVIKEEASPAEQLQAYVVPKKSQFYFIPYGEGENGLRFTFLWAARGLSRNTSMRETGKGWKLYVAEEDYRNILPVGTHMATATLEPIAESEYGSKKPRSEYVSRFKFAVQPGLNIYVINYVYRRDRPEIFVRRLEIDGVRNVREQWAVKRITEVYRVYGEE